MNQDKDKNFIKLLGAFRAARDDGFDENLDRLLIAVSAFRYKHYKNELHKKYQARIKDIEMRGKALEERKFVDFFDARKNFGSVARNSKWVKLLLFLATEPKKEIEL